MRLLSERATCMFSIENLSMRTYMCAVCILHIVCIHDHNIQNFSVHIPHIYYPIQCLNLFSSRSHAPRAPAGTKIALRFPRLFVCLFVCASALIACTIYYVMRYYATAVYSSFWRFAGQATENEGSFVLPRWRKHGR